jgi:hypothetical protein
MKPRVIRESNNASYLYLTLLRETTLLSHPFLLIATVSC